MNDTREWIIAGAEIVIAISAAVGFMAPRVKSLGQRWIDGYNANRASKLDIYVEEFWKYGWKIEDALDYARAHPKDS